MGKMWGKTLPRIGVGPALVARILVAPMRDWHPDWVDESETSHETSFWLSQAEALDIIAQARAELADGRGMTEAQIRSELGVHNPLA